MSVTFRFNENLKIRKNANGANAKTVINAPFISDGSNFNSLCFTASGVMQYDSIPFYDESRYILNFKTDIHSITLPNVIVNGYYHNGNFYLRYDPTSGYTDLVIGVTNKLYADKNGNGVYIFNGRYVNVFDLNDDNAVSLYYSVSLGNNIFVVAKSEYNLTNKKNVLNVLRNQDGYYYMKDPYRNTYCLQYVENDNEYETSFVSYVWYGHWLKQSRRTIVFENGVPSVDEATLNWLSENGSITNDVLITNRDSLVAVANAIREQVGDSSSVTYYYPDRDDTENTFVKKIKQLNNTYTHDGDGAVDKDVLENKTYWRDGEQHVGIMPDNSGWGTKNITVKNQEVPIPRGYHDGRGRVRVSLGDQSKIIPDNIKKDVTILGVTGSNTVIETDAVKNNEFDTLCYNVVTPSTLLEGYGAFISGGVVTGSIKDYANGTINAPINVRASSSSEKISAQMNFTETVGGQSVSFDFARMSPRTTVTVPYSIFGNKEAYPDLKIVHYGGTSLGNRDMHLADASQYISQNISILGVEGTMPAITDTQLADAVYVDSTNGIINLDTNNGVYVNSNCGFYTTYSNLITAYNTDTSAVSDKIISSNIKKGSTILGVPGSSTVVDVSDTTATAGLVSSGSIFYDKNGVRQIGTALGAAVISVDFNENYSANDRRFAVSVGGNRIVGDGSVQAPVGAEVVLIIYPLGNTSIPFYIYNGSQLVAQGNEQSGKLEYRFSVDQSYKIVCDTMPSTVPGMEIGGFYINFKSTNSIVDVIRTTATAGDVLLGKQFYNRNGQLTSGTINNNGSVSATISAKSQIASIPAGYTSGGEVSIAQSEQDKIIPENIVADKTILGVEGKFVEKIQVHVNGNSSDPSGAVCAVEYGGSSYHYGDTFNATLYKSQRLPITMYIACVGIECTGYNIFQNGQLVYSGAFNYSGTPIVVERDIFITEESLVSVSSVVGGTAIINVSKYAYRLSTVGASDVLSGKVTYDKNGNPVNGTLRLGEKEISSSGTYNAADSGLSGFNEVTVVVPQWQIRACKLTNSSQKSDLYVEYNNNQYKNAGTIFGVEKLQDEYESITFVMMDRVSAQTVVYGNIYINGVIPSDYNPQINEGEYIWQPTGDFEVTFGSQTSDLDILVTVYSDGGIDVSDTTATPNTVLSGYSFYNANGEKVSGNIPERNHSDIECTDDGKMSVNAGYYSQSYLIPIDKEASVATSVSITDVNNCLTTTPTNFIIGYGATVTATDAGWVDEGSLGGDGDGRYIKESGFQSNQTISTKSQSVSISEGYTVGGTVGISSTEQAKIIASNIKSGVTILGVTGTYAPSTGGYSCLITSSDQSVPNQYVCVSGNSFTDYYSQTNKHFVASTLSCKASYGPAGTNHVYFNNVEQTLDSNNECTIQLVTDVNITITGTPGSGATITITNV